MRIFLLHLILLYSISIYSQNVGIGTATPVARLHVADSAVLFTGPVTVSGSTLFAPPASGAGTRFMWYPQKAALRAGFSVGTEWDKDSIGLYSLALGYGVKASGQNSVSIGALVNATGLNATSMGVYTTASGNYSTSTGNNTTASGNYSTGMGYYTTASGHYSTSMGNYTTASGNYSSGMGYNTTASGQYSTSMGNSTTASGINSTSMGYNTTASGFFSTSMGFNTTASGDYSICMGYATKSKAQYSLVIGLYNDTTQTNRLFEVGNGTADNARNNAFTVLMNGNVGIGNNNPDAPLSFTSGAGEKIALYPYTSTQRHGIGVFSGSGYSAMRLYVPSVADFISWGIGSYNNFTENMSLSGDGILRVRTSVIAPYAFAPSDIRYKTGLQLIDDPLAKLGLLHGYTYYYRTGAFPEQHFAEREQVGVVAQEVEAVLPQAVNTDKDGYKSVDYSKLVPLLIEGMKAQQEQIRVQDEKINLLLKRLEVLEQQKQH